MFCSLLNIFFSSCSSTGWRVAEHGRRRVEDVVIGRIAGFFGPATVPAGGQERPHVLGKWLSFSPSLLSFLIFIAALFPFVFFLVVCVDIIIIFPLSSSYSHSLCLEAVSSIFLLLLRIPDEAVSRQEPPQQVQQHSTGEQTITTRTDALRAVKRQEISSAASVFFISESRSKKF